MADSAVLPLEGVRVLELAHLIAGPVCGMYLADMGADVIKVESRDAPDAGRDIYRLYRGGEGVLHLTVNRNKRGLGVDLRSERGRAVFRRLAAGADVVIEAYRGGVAERLGIDWDSLAPLNPASSTARSRPSGPGGPGARSPASTPWPRPWGASWPSPASATAAPSSGARRWRTPSARSWPSRASSPRLSRAGEPDADSAWTPPSSTACCSPIPRA